MKMRNNYGLAEFYAKAKRDYSNMGYGEDSWQWQDEGLVYAIMDYLSSFEMSEADWEFARKEGIEDVCMEVIDDE